LVQREKVVKYISYRTAQRTTAGMLLHQENSSNCIPQKNSSSSQRAG